MPATDTLAIFARLDPPVWLLTAQTGGQRGGMIATFVNQASIVPAFPRVLVGLARHHFTWELVEASGAFVLHQLAEEHLSLVWRFGLQTGRDVDKLDGLPVTTTAARSLRLVDVPAWLDCRVEARLSTGDRTIYVAEVTDAAMVLEMPPLTLKRVVQLAPAEKLQELKQQMLRDQTIDEAAITKWRQEGGRSSGSES